MDHPIATGVGGAGSRLALAWATEHAERTGDRLVLVHVCWPGSPLSQAPGDPAPAEIAFIDPPLAHALTRTRTRLGPHHAAVELRSGEPEDCLTDVSQRSRMLVIGDGEGGRTVRRVLRHARCPVVVVRPGTTAADTPFAGQVVAAVDGSTTDRTVLEFAARYAATHQLPLTAVHVTSGRGTQPPPAGVARCARRHPTLTVRSTVLAGPVPDTLVRATAGAHLLVVGDKRRGVIGRARTRDIPMTVATEAPCPVAVVQAPEPGRAGPGATVPRRPPPPANRSDSPGCRPPGDPPTLPKWTVSTYGCGQRPPNVAPGRSGGTEIMYSPPWYVWVICLIGAIGIPAATCLMLYRGARSAGSSRPRAALLAAAAGTVLGGWLAASAVIAARGLYRGTLDEPPWLGIAAGGCLIALLAMSRIPAVARALAAPGSLSRSALPHAFRVAGVSFLVVMALGHLSWLFAIPAGLGDTAIGMRAPFVARRLARGTGHRGAVWFHALGTLDLITALVLGGLTSYGILHTTPPSDALPLLPIVLIPTASVPLLLALHVVALRHSVARSGTARSVATPAAAALG